MNLFDLAAFAIKHKDDFAKLVPQGAKDPTLIKDAAAFVKKHFPQYNPNGLIDDALALLDPPPQP